MSDRMQGTDREILECSSAKQDVILAEIERAKQMETFGSAGCLIGGAAGAPGGGLVGAIFGCL